MPLVGVHGDDFPGHDWFDALFQVKLWGGIPWHSVDLNSVWTKLTQDLAQKTQDSGLTQDLSKELLALWFLSNNCLQRRETSVRAENTHSPSYYCLRHTCRTWFGDCYLFRVSVGFWYIKRSRTRPRLRSQMPQQGCLCSLVRLGSWYNSFKGLAVWISYQSYNTAFKTFATCV